MEFVGGMAGVVFVPRAPFVHDEPDAALGIVAVHDRAVPGEEFVEEPAVGHDAVPVGGVELRGRHQPGGLRGWRQAVHVVVEREPVHHGAVEARVGALAHDDLGPGVVVHGGAGGDAVEPGLLVVAEEAREAAELVGVIFGAHHATAAPALIADAPETHAVGRGMAVGGALVGQDGADGGVEILHPVAHLLYGAAAEVAADHGLAADLRAEIEKLMRAEGVGLDLAPGVIAHPRAFFARTDAVAPVVGVGETAARPAEIRDLDRAQGGDDVGAETADVGDGRVLADPEALVHAAAEVLGELAENVAADLRPRLVGGDGEDDAVGVHAAEPR